MCKSAHNLIELASIKDNKRTKYLFRAERIDLGMRKVEWRREGESELQMCKRYSFALRKNTLS
jgi:hypothetical protein